jgi:hypothetical protein
MKHLKHLKYTFATSTFSVTSSYYLGESRLVDAELDASTKLDATKVASAYLIGSAELAGNTELAGGYMLTFSYLDHY